MRKFLLLAFVLCAAVAHGAGLGNRRALLGGNRSAPPVPPVLVYTNDFRTTCLPSGFTFTRASNAWDYNTAGTLITYANNVPACPGSWLGNGTNHGLGMWALRTNILQNAATCATQTRTSSNGTNFAWIKGTGSMALSGTGVSCTATEASPCRYFTSPGTPVTFTLSGTVNFCQSEFVFAADVAGNPTAPISTAAASATRQPDIMSSPSANIGLNSSSGTFIFRDVFVPTTTSQSNRTIWMASNGAGNNGFRLYIRATDGKPQIACENAGVLQFSAVSPTVVTGGTRATIGVAYDANGVTVAVDGNAFATTAGNCAYAITQINLGTNQAGSFALNGYIGKVDVYNTRVGNAALQALTSPPNNALSGPLKLLWADGQSNCAGAKATPPLTLSPIYPNNVFMPNDYWGVGGPRLNYYYLSFGNPGISSVIPAFEALGPSPPFNPPVDTYFAETGITAWANELIFEGDTAKYVARGACAGGQPIAALLPGAGGSYSSIKDSTAVLHSLAVFNGGSVNADSFMFVHGETDRNQGTARATYAGAVLSLSLAATSDLKTITSQANDPIFYMMQLQASGVANGTGSPISMAQYDITVGTSASASWRLCAPRYMFPTTGYVNAPAYPDGLHHTNTAIIWSGEYAGHCRRWEAVNGLPWKPTYPTTVAFDAVNKALIRTTWNVPVSPLVLDTTSPLQGAAYMHGLQYVDDCVLASLALNQQPYTYITNVATTGATTIDVTLSTVRSGACANPMLRNAYDGPVVADQRSVPTIVSGGSGGIDGPCTITTNYNPGFPGVAQATYSATIVGGALSTITANIYPGLWPHWDVGAKNSVGVTGCSLVGATVDGLSLRRGLSSLDLSAAWSGIRDSDTSVSRSGNALRNWAVVFELPVTP